MEIKFFFLTSPKTSKLIPFNSYLNSLIFHMIHLHTFYLPSNFYDTWSTASWSKSPKLAIFQFVIHMYIYSATFQLEVLNNSTELNFQNSKILDDF
jgi:hypothetical protein